MRRYKKQSQLLIIVLVVGFFVGVICQNIISRNHIFMSEVFSRSNLERYRGVSVIEKEYLWYVVKTRAVMLCLIWLLGKLKWKKLYVLACLGISGFFFGVLLVTATIQLGMKGILLCLVGVLPQAIFYIAAYTMLWTYWYRYPDSRWNHAKTLFVLMTYLVGILLETYVNPIVVKLIIGIL